MRKLFINASRISHYALLFILFPCLAYAAYIPDQVIVKFRDASVITPTGAISSKTQNSFTVIGIEKSEQVFPQKRISTGIISQQNKQSTLPRLDLTYLLSLKANSDVSKAVSDLKKLPEIEYAEPNYIIRALSVPNDPYYGDQWGLQNISAEGGWNASTGTSDVVVAVVDTGIDYTHPDLTLSKVIKGTGYTNRSHDPLDDNGHGTHLAGVIGALTNNGQGIAGLNWNCKLLAVKVLDASGNGTTSNVAQGIVYAADYPANIINMSFGDTTDTATIKDAITYAYGKGCVLIAAAGNENTDTKMYPAAYDSYVIAVAATDQDDKRSVWTLSQASNYGTWVDVAAPGTAIFSTWLNPTYINESGTSMATPHVSGLASLLLSQNPALSQEEVRSNIESTCDNIDTPNPGFENKLGKGRINCSRALGLPVVSITSPADSAYVSGTFNITGTAKSTNIANYQVSIGTGNPASLYETIFTNDQSVENGILYPYNSTNKPDGVYTIKLLCQSRTPTTAETTSIVNLDNQAPLADIFAPVNNATIEGLITIEGVASDSHLLSYTLSYSTDGIDYTTISTTTSPPDNNFLGTWNTSGLSGQYNLRLSVKDIVGHESSKIITLNIASNSNIDTSPTVIPGLLKSTPNPFNPSAQTLTYLTFSLDTNHATTIYLFSMNGDLIYTKSFSSGENGAKSGENLVPWDGKNSQGQFVDNGVYFFKVASNRAGSKKIIGSGRIIVIKN